MSPRRRRYALPALCGALVAVVILLDWITPPGVVVGLLLSAPIVLASLAPGPRAVWLVSALAHGYFLATRLSDPGPQLPPEVWITNRLFTFVSLVAATWLALVLQRQRLAVERARDQALHAREVNRLLMSLLAHDLRTPLVLAVQGLDYVEGSLRPGHDLDREMLQELRGRLGRSLHTVEVVLGAARREESLPGERVPAGSGPLGDEIRREVEAFRSEAAVEGKDLHLAVDRELDPAAARVNRLVLRQVLAILLDNAIRYAAPGRVEVDATLEGEHLVLRVADGGPGFARGRGRSDGAGLGLELAGSLVGFAGGELRIERDGSDGCCLAARLPLEPGVQLAAHPLGPPPALALAAL